MSDTPQGDGWWIASDGKWYAPELHPDYVPPVAASPEPVAPIVPEVSQPVEPVAPITPQTPSTTTAPASTAPSSTVPAATLPATEAAEPSSRRGLIIALAAIVLIAGLGLLAFRAFGGGSAGTGAALPEAAVRQLIDSVRETDPVGLVEVLDPDEIEGWFGSFVPASETMQAFAGEEGERDAAAIDPRVQDLVDLMEEAITIDITGPDGAEFEFETTSLDTNGRISRVRLSGFDARFEANDLDGQTIIVASSTDAFGLDIGEGTAELEIRDQVDGLSLFAQSDGIDESEFLPDVHMDLVTVEKEGEWYISIGYSTMELIRGANSNEFAEPDFGRGYALVDSGDGGAATAEDAVRGFMTSIEDLDYDTMIRLTDPVSLPYLHDYQSSIDANIDPNDRREAVASNDVRIDTLELSTSTWNDRGLVTIDRIAGSAADTTFEFDGATWCAQATSSSGDVSEGCLEDAINEFLDLFDERSILAQDLIPDAVGIVVVERNGRWFIDPLGTLGYYTDQLADVVSELDLDELQNSTARDLDAFVAVRGPVLGNGEAAVLSPEASGAVGAAIDIQDLPVAGSGSFDQMRAALVRIEADANAGLIGQGPRGTNDDIWVVAHYSSDDEPIFPAVAVATEGEVKISVESPVINIVDGETFSGSIDNEGRPQILVFEESGDWELDGPVTFTTVYGGTGTVAEDPFFSSSYGDPSYGNFAVVHGDPGATFVARSFQFEPAPDPVPAPEPFGPSSADERVNRFIDIAAGSGYETFSFEQFGGYFDGCGPDDPDVTTYAYEDNNGALALITPYPSEQRAAAALDALAAMASPCDNFPDIEIVEVTFDPDQNHVTVKYQFEGSTDPAFERYGRRGDVIIVVTAYTLDEIDYLWGTFDSYTG